MTFAILQTVTLWDWLKEGSLDFKKFPGWRSWGVSDKEATVAQFGQNIFIKKIRCAFVSHQIP